MKAVDIRRGLCFLLAGGCLGGWAWAEGGLDPGFGDGGAASVELNVPLSSLPVLAFAVQGDDKIVMASVTFNGVDSDFLLARFTAEGALDSGFGTGGVVTTAVSAGDDVPTAVAVDPASGAILVVGHAWDGSRYDAIVARYTAAGRLDANFGNAGMAQFVSGGGNNFQMFDVVIQQGGGVVVAAADDGQEQLLRLVNGAEIDNTFGNAGVVDLAFSGTGFNIALTQTPAGHIVAAGGTGELAQFDGAGVPDLFFGASGRAAVSPIWSAVSQVVVDDSGRILVAGVDLVFDDPQNPSHFTQHAKVARFGAAGIRELGFGDSGVFTRADDSAAFSVLGLGEAIYAATSEQLLKLTDNGRLDNAFGLQGALRVEDIDGDSVTPVALLAQSGGRVLVGGAAAAITGWEGYLARVVDDGDGDEDQLFDSDNSAVLGRSSGGGGVFQPLVWGVLIVVALAVRRAWVNR